MNWFDHMQQFPGGYNRPDPTEYTPAQAAAPTAAPAGSAEKILAMRQRLELGQDLYHDEDNPQAWSGCHCAAGQHTCGKYDVLRDACGRHYR